MSKSSDEQKELARVKWKRLMADPAFREKERLRNQQRRLDPDCRTNSPHPNTSDLAVTQKTDNDSLKNKAVFVLYV